MSARTTRTRLFAATALALAALSLTACNDGEGGSDEGASTASPSATGNPGGSGNSAGTSRGSDGSGNAGAESPGGPKRSAGTGGPNSAAGSAGSEGGSGSVPCTAATTKTTATVVSRPVNHLLVTVTNTGSKRCDLVGYPVLRFEHAQSVPPVNEDSKPQAVVTLAPGDSGYAGVTLSAGDGSGSNGHTARTLDVLFGDGSDGSDSAAPALPAAGVHIDDKLTTTYWQQELDDALLW
ncbi:DUF4232 domain-containing protein [Streptomyces sp. NPDC050560]|uniref:DUF4232 domain-containing protein n=1 Tax=Streptomyces sp. NPDC050560 TaxID=3365630 RepID=UPI00378EEFD5